MVRYYAIFAGTAVVLTATALSFQALAQKSKNTVRYALTSPLVMADPIYNPGGDTTLLNVAIHDQLLRLDPKKGKFLPGIAESWKRINPTTYEFKLKKGLKFHDGSDLDAEDVAYTINFLSNPKVRFRIKSRFLWIKGAEKINQHTVRLTTKKPAAFALMRASASLLVFPSDMHGSLAKKNAFGLRPVGSGPYRAVQIDRNKGAILERFKDYKLAADGHPAGSIDRFIAIPIPDVQSQVAQLLTGGVDLTRNLPKDQVDSLRSKAEFAISAQDGPSYSYINMDARGRSDQKAFKDIRVRKAVLHAINRRAIQDTFINRGKELPLPRAMCRPYMIGCDFSATIPGYDPAKAKKLLAEAGFPEGFVAEIVATSGMRAVAQAVGGDLRKIGIKTTIQAVPLVAFRKLERSGKVQLRIGGWGAPGGVLDINTTTSYFFAPGGRNYNMDPALIKLRGQADITLDNSKRKAIAKQIFNRVTEQAYLVPIAWNLTAYVHAKDLNVPNPGPHRSMGAKINELRWK